jgi:hypothetical protein
MSTALKIYHWDSGNITWDAGNKIDQYNFEASSIDFDDEEYLRGELIPYHEIAVQINQDVSPIVFDRQKTRPTDSGGQINSTGNIIKLQILHIHKTTKADIENLMSGSLVKVYYKYLDDQTAYKIGIIDPNYKNVYHHGKQAAMIRSDITIYETSNYNEVPNA